MTPPSYTTTAYPSASIDSMRGQLRALRTHYERHVLAWYALSRPHQARIARDAIARQRDRLLATEDGPVAPQR